MDAKSYMLRIAAVDVQQFNEIEVETIDDAEAMLALIKAMLAELQQIKRDLTADMKAIRNDYGQQISDVRNQYYGWALLGARRAAGHYRASKRDRLTQERNSALGPYEDVKFQLDGMIDSVGRVKAELTEYIRQEKARMRELKAAHLAIPVPEKPKRSEKPKRTETAYCPSCGATVGESDRFCRKCGYKLEGGDVLAPPDDITPPAG